MNFHALHPLHFDLGQTVLFQHVHASDKERDCKTLIARCNRERCKLAEIGTGSSDKNDRFAHTGLYLLANAPRKWPLMFLRMAVGRQGAGHKLAV